MGFGLSWASCCGGRPRRRRRRRRPSASCFGRTGARARALLRPSSTPVRHADGRRVSVVSLRVGVLRQVVPDSLEFYFDLVAREYRVRRGTPRATRSFRPRFAAASAGSTGSSSGPPFTLPGLRRGADAKSSPATNSRSSRSNVRGRGMHRTQREGARGRPRRERDDRAGEPRPTSIAHGVTVVNLMSAPGAGKTSLLEARPRVVSTASASACSKATCRPRSTPTGSRSLPHPGDPDQHRPGFGGECHLDANMVRSALAVARRSTSSTSS